MSSKGKCMKCAMKIKNNIFSVKRKNLNIVYEYLDEDNNINSLINNMQEINI